MQKYTHDARVVFSFLSPEGNVSHVQFAKLFGDVRELFGLDVIPGFKDEIGKKYLLKTVEASYQFKKDFVFGDTIRIEMYIDDLNGASFRLGADFVNPATGEVHAIGMQRLAFTDMMGRVSRIPEGLRDLLESVMIAA